MHGMRGRAYYMAYIQHVGCAHNRRMYLCTTLRVAQQYPCCLPNTVGTPPRSPSPLSLPPRSILYWNATGVLADLYDTFAGGTAPFRATAAALRMRAAHVRTQISRELWSDAKGAFVVRARPPTNT